ncbi:hypothetical protein BLNAU_19568 [Blattamonas nauphoetae]|uniref:Uncharacterized protein n=1 Tax=Blattamonas nauphoetae TaxID=2049346 RepID=A0ABQ9X1D9_9EUKA|nr:hypothetical protein BLNAU_19568 [Blattamonas nauphoetae]
MNTEPQPKEESKCYPSIPTLPVESKIPDATMVKILDQIEKDNETVQLTAIDGLSERIRKDSNPKEEVVCAAVEAGIMQATARVFTKTESVVLQKSCRVLLTLLTSFSLPAEQRSNADILNPLIRLSQIKDSPLTPHVLQTVATLSPTIKTRAEMDSVLNSGVLQQLCDDFEKEESIDRQIVQWEVLDVFCGSIRNILMGPEEASDPTKEAENEQPQPAPRQQAPPDTFLMPASLNRRCKEALRRIKKALETVIATKRKRMSQLSKEEKNLVRLAGGTIMYLIPDEEVDAKGEIGMISLDVEKAITAHLSYVSTVDLGRGKLSLFNNFLPGQYAIDYNRITKQNNSYAPILSEPIGESIVRLTIRFVSLGSYFHVGVVPADFTIQTTDNYLGYHPKSASFEMCSSYKVAYFSKKQAPQQQNYFGQNGQIVVIEVDGRKDKRTMRMATSG